MDSVRLGRGIRALRLHHGLRQADLARRTGLSDTIVSRIERGHGDRVTGRTLDRLAHALGGRLIVRLDWNGEAIDRLLDAGHAALVEVVVARLRVAGWTVEPEATFAVGGERGSIDVLGWHPASNSLLVVEVKSIVPDIQAMLSALDRKVRLAPQVGVARGWRARSVSRILVVGDSRTSRRRVDAHAQTFDARFADRFLSIRRFIADPDGRRIEGLWFVPFPTGATARHRVPRSRARTRA